MLPSVIVPTVRSSGTNQGFGKAPDMRIEINSVIQFFARFFYPDLFFLISLFANCSRWKDMGTQRVVLLKAFGLKVIHVFFLDIMDCR